MEVSRVFDDKLDRKWNADRLKTTKTMRNLLVRIGRRFMDSSLLNKVQVVGIVAAGIAPPPLGLPPCRRSRVRPTHLTWLQASIANRSEWFGVVAIFVC